MKKRLRKLAMILIVIGMAGCQNTTQAETPETVITMRPEVLPTPEPEKNPEGAATEIPQKDGTVTMQPEAEPTVTPEPADIPTSEPTATVKPMTDDITMLVVALPDDSERLWKNEWFESETNVKMTLEKVPKHGRVRIKLCYPDSVDALNREDEFELFVGEQSMGFSVNDSLEEGTIGGSWKYYTFEMDYNGNGKAKELIVKTHSPKGSKGTAFAVADLTVTDRDTGNVQAVDFLSEDESLKFQRINFLAGEVKECDFDIHRIDKKTMVKQESKSEPTRAPEPTKVPEPTKAPKPTQAVVGSDWYHLTYRLAETNTGWWDVWSESESNIIFLYSSDKSLSQGTASLTLSVPKLSGVNRVDTFEWAVHAQDDFMNWTGSTMEIIYDGDQIIANDPARGVQELTEYDGHYQVKIEVNYDNSKVKDGRELQLIFKSHCGSQTGAYEVTLSDLEIRDDRTGTELVDFSGDEVEITGKMYVSNQPVEYTLSKNVLEFYIKNSVSKMPVGEQYQVEVYSSGEGKLKFESSDTKVLTVDATGKLTSHKKGTGTVTVTNQATGQQESFTVTVSEPVIIATEYEILMITGREGRMHFMTDYATKEGVYQYASSNASVATVDESGLVKAKKDGITTITVTDTANEVTLSFELEVYTPEDKDGVGQYISMAKTGYVTADIAKRSYQQLYDVYKNVFDYFNYGEYEDVTLFFTVKDYSPAYSDCVDIYLASEHMLANAKDVDCITHELIHCAQDYISVWENDVWLMEGLTDYGRYLFGLHNEDCGWALPEYDVYQHYTDSYTTTAAFIKFVTDNYCEDMPHIINKMFKEPDGYDDSIWKTNTGYTIDELWELYAKS